MRRITITVAEATLQRVRQRVRGGDASSVSAYFAELADRQTREDELAELLDELDAQLGPPSEDDVAWARRVAGAEA